MSAKKVRKNRRIDSLYRFIDWVMDLPDNLTRKFDADIMQFEEELEMPYVTSTERNGIRKGRVEGRVEATRESIVRVLRKRFHTVPRSLKRKIDDIQEYSKLNELLDWALDADSLKNFRLK